MDHIKIHQMSSLVPPWQLRLPTINLRPILHTLEHVNHGIEHIVDQVRLRVNLLFLRQTPILDFNLDLDLERSLSLAVKLAQDLSERAIDTLAVTIFKYCGGSHSAHITGPAIGTVIGIGVLVLCAYLVVRYVRRSQFRSRDSARQIHIDQRAQPAPVADSAAVDPPHLILLRYIYPSTSLWPPAYLRAFHHAATSQRDQNGHAETPPSWNTRKSKDGRAKRWSGKVVLSKKMVKADLNEGVIGLRQGQDGTVGLNGVGEMAWEGVEWIDQTEARSSCR